MEFIRNNIPITNLCEILMFSVTFHKYSNMTINREMEFLPNYNVGEIQL